MKRGAERRGGEVPEYWYEAPVYYKGNHRSTDRPGRRVSRGPATRSSSTSSSSSR